MNRSEILAVLNESKPYLAQEFGVTELALFGSHARGSGQVDSDVDIIVDFEGAATSRRYFGVQFYLEDRFGLPVDLVTRKAIREELKPSIERDTIHA